MTKEEEIPDSAGAQEFYDKYESKEILGRYVYNVLKLARSRGSQPGGQDPTTGRKLWVPSNYDLLDNCMSLGL